MKKLCVNADCFDVLPKIENKSAQLVFTGIPDSNDLGMDLLPEEYENFIDDCLNHFTRITKDNGFIALCQTDRKKDGRVLSKHSVIISKMEKLGWILKDYKIVLKRKMPNAYKDQFVFPYFQLCIFTIKGRIKRTGEWLRQVLDYEMKKQGSFYVFPEEFVRLMIDFLTIEDDLVIDPFAGSGIIPFISYSMKRDFIGIEIDEDTYTFGKYAEILDRDD